MPSSAATTLGVKVEVVSELRSATVPPDSTPVVLSLHHHDHEPKGRDRAIALASLDYHRRAQGMSTRSAASASSPSSRRLSLVKSYWYSSGAPLTTASGKMEGTFQMVAQSGQLFDVKIARFNLEETTVHEAVGTTGTTHTTGDRRSKERAAAGQLPFKEKLTCDSSFRGPSHRNVRVVLVIRRQI